ncbi:MAG: transporter substrate-binding domain-containing protein [Coriobacteriia bacterium]|nr:transporter substrate-binding domain-containing protein [Coriobacteriia bacterium]
MKKKMLVLVIAFALVLSVTALVGCGTEEAATTGSTGVSSDIQKIKDAGVLKVGVKVDVPNFGYKDPKTNKIDGFEIDLARQLAKRILGDESKIQLEPVTAKTRGPLLDNGQLDVVIATFTIKPDRLLQWNFSDGYYTDEVGILVKKNSGIAGLKDLNGKKVGVAQGATTKDAIEAEIATQKLSIKPNYLEFASYPEINAALESGRIDAFSVDKSILTGYLSSDKVILAEGFAPQEYGIATKKGNDGITEECNTMLKEMTANGEMATLLKKWNLN